MKTDFSSKTLPHFVNPWRISRHVIWVLLHNGGFCNGCISKPSFPFTRKPILCRLWKKIITFFINLIFYHREILKLDHFMTLSLGLCQHRSVMQPQQNPPFCSSTVIWTFYTETGTNTTKLNKDIIYLNVVLRIDLINLYYLVYLLIYLNVVLRIDLINLYYLVYWLNPL